MAADTVFELSLLHLTLHDISRRVVFHSECLPCEVEFLLVFDEGQQLI